MPATQLPPRASDPVLVNLAELLVWIVGLDVTRKDALGLVEIPDGLGVLTFFSMIACEFEVGKEIVRLLGQNRFKLFWILQQLPLFQD
jgi:hypothetical protein